MVSIPESVAVTSTQANDSADHDNIASTLTGNGDEGGGLQEENDTATSRNVTIKELIGRKRRRKGMKLMPSTMKRLEERKKRRQAEKSKDQQTEDAMSVASQPNTSGRDSIDANGELSTENPANNVRTSEEVTIDVAPEPEIGGEILASENAGSVENAIIDDDETGEVVAPQVTLDENGNIIIDQDSLFISANNTVNENEQTFNTVEHHSLGNPISSASFKKREASLKWSKTETDQFYEALRVFGTDFTLMASRFPNRTRRTLKFKYKREERDFPERVDAALNGPRLPMPNTLSTTPSISDSQDRGTTVHNPPSPANTPGPIPEQGTVETNTITSTRAPEEEARQNQSIVKNPDGMNSLENQGEADPPSTEKADVVQEEVVGRLSDNEEAAEFFDDDDDDDDDDGDSGEDENVNVDTGLPKYIDYDDGDYDDD